MFASHILLLSDMGVGPAIRPGVRIRGPKFGDRLAINLGSDANKSSVRSWIEGFFAGTRLIRRWCFPSV